MLIVCPSCATSYDVKVASLSPNGRQVRCLRCQAVWHAAPSQADKLFAAADAIAPAGASAALAALSTGQEMADGYQTNSRRPALAAAETASKSVWTEPAADERPAVAEPLDDQSVVAPQDANDDTFDVDAAAEPAAEEAAEFAEGEAPPIVPVDLDEGRPPIEIDADDFADHNEEPHEDVETVAARRYPRDARGRGKRWPLSRLQTGIMALVMIDLILVGWRSDVVRILPQTASFYAALGLGVNLRGLAFDGLTTTTEQHEGVPILVVEGNIVNDARKVVDVPRLKFVVRNAERQEIYSWTAVPSTGVLPPGEAVAFHTRLASPPPEARDVLVRFVNRRDVLSAR